MVVVLRINIRCVLYRQIKGIIRPNSIAHKKSKLLGCAAIEKENRWEQYPANMYISIFSFSLIFLLNNHLFDYKD